MAMDLVPLVANLGFLIVVSLYLLLRVEKRLEEMIIIKDANENIKENIKFLSNQSARAHYPGRIPRPCLR
ncbi:MAG: YvrJ family protein [Firmicutes bacterium]|nr:YvrJ family protein [Bacillota bacterium]